MGRGKRIIALTGVVLSILILGLSVSCLALGLIGTTQSWHKSTLPEKLVLVLAHAVFFSPKQMPAWTHHSTRILSSLVLLKHADVGVLYAVCQLILLGLGMGRELLWVHAVP